MMKITHLGAKYCVTGSCHLIQTLPGSADSINIMVDCGNAQGDDSQLPFSQIPVLPDNIHYLFLTHAHIDHIGRVPDLIEAGFHGEIICTHATKACSGLCSAMPCRFPETAQAIIRNRIQGLQGKTSWRPLSTISPGDSNSTKSSP